jgi:hypothetical protein
MKLSFQAAALFTAAIFFTACQKTNDPGAGVVSVGSLQSSATGNCTPVTVHGLFKVDSVLTSDNYVDIQVDVSVAGSFSIKSDSINGYSFKKTGTISPGLNTIRLYASGKPIATGVNNFTISYGITVCRFSITVFGAGGGFGTALYTLGGSPGNCSVSSITGNYVTDLAMTPSNKVEMTVNVTTAGTYNIATTSINGVTFSANGTFSNPGIQNIFLTAAGTPIAAGVFNYPVTNGATNCSFSITYTTVITNATFALSGSPGNCTGAVVNGTYTAGTALTATNTAVINVNVTSPGNYAIATTTANGISFSASGTFNLTGPQQVTLTGTGTPAVAGSFNYPLSGGGNTCTFSITSASGLFTCKIDGVFTNFSSSGVANILEMGTGTPYLHLLGLAGPPGPSVPQAEFWITNNNNSPILPGSYNENGYFLPNGYLISINFNLLSPGPGIYPWGTYSNVTPPLNPPFTVVVTSVTATRAIGTFSGQIQTTAVSGLPNKIITEGAFNLPVQ